MLYLPALLRLLLFCVFDQFFIYKVLAGIVKIPFCSSQLLIVASRLEQ